MLKKIKNSKKILVDDLNDNQEAIKVSDFDLNNKIIFDSVKYYLKQYRKERTKENLANVMVCIYKLSKLNGVNIDGDQELINILDSKSINKNIVKIIVKGKEK